MYPTSPKGLDLERDGGHVALLRGRQRWWRGEFSVRGYGARVVADGHREVVAEAGLSEREGFALYELGVDQAFSMVYGGGEPAIERWRR